MRGGFIALALLLCGPAAADSSAWSRLSAPLPGTAEAVGFYSAGCLLGGQALAPQGVGYQAMRLSRNRNYAHPSLIGFIEWLGRQAHRRGSRLLIGDLSQPGGGPMNYGHASHQLGLDADIWLRHIPAERRLNRQQIESWQQHSTVDRAAGRLNERWTPLYRRLLQLTAEYPAVERIFVNPVIKQQLCARHAGSPWLAKLRPWWGHDAHFHVRLRCPAENLDCRAQQPVPPGDGCNADLARWVEQQKRPPSGAKFSPRKPKPLPPRCQAALPD